MKRLLIHFERLGPYHLARIHAAHTFFSAQGWQVTALEIASRDRTYQWREESGDSAFDRITLFPCKEYDSLTPQEIRGAVTRALGQMAPDAVAICGYYSPDACALLSSARRLGARAILMSESTRGDHRRNPLKELFKAWRLREFHSALCGGIPHRDYLIGLGMPAGKIFTGYNAVDNDFFERESRVAVEKELIPDCLRQLAPGRFFLASNRFVPRKNLGALIGAYADYARRVNEPWGMVLLGDGPERSFLESLVHKHKLTDKVFFPGFRQIDELPAFYAHAGAFVHVPLSEPWGLVVNEAMACGLPVIVSSTAGCARDLCRHGINGLQVDPRSAEQIARALEAVSTHSSVSESFALESWSIIRDYSPGQFAQGLWKAVTVA